MNLTQPVTAALTAAAVLLAAEVRRVARERDAAQQEFSDLVARLADRPTTALMAPAVPAAPPISLEPAYVSDLPYHDELWDEFANANEAPDEPPEDDS